MFLLSYSLYILIRNRSLPVGPDFKNSNNVAELLAVKEALIRVTGSNAGTIRFNFLSLQGINEFMLAIFLILIGPIKLVINTDSKYVIRCFMYSVKKWKAKGWMTSSGTPVENKAIIEEIDNIMSSSGIVIKWVRKTHFKIACFTRFFNFNLVERYFVESRAGSQWLLW